MQRERVLLPDIRVQGVPRMGGHPEAGLQQEGLLSHPPPSPHGLGPRSLLLQLGMTRGRRMLNPPLRVLRAERIQEAHRPALLLSKARRDILRAADVSLGKSPRPSCRHASTRAGPGNPGILQARPGSQRVTRFGKSAPPQEAWAPPGPHGLGTALS